MSSYTITITPDDTTHASTTLRIDVSDATARISELLVRAGAAAGLSPQQLPVIDLDLLLRAVTPGSVNEVVAADAVEAKPRGRRAAATGTRRRGRPAAASSEAAPRKRGGRRAGQPAKSGGKAAGRRAYRRMPSDFVEVYRRLGGASAVAQHYDVPAHSVQGWIRRLREAGELETP